VSILLKRSVNRWVGLLEAPVDDELVCSIVDTYLSIAFNKACSSSVSKVVVELDADAVVAEVVEDDSFGGGPGGGP
jgi:hypothetical protein